MFNIKEELKKLPEKPGVYLMKDFQDTIIYVGKAINLKNRVRSYFRKSSVNKDLKVASMVKYIKEFEYIITDTELEALILEKNLIKEYMPKFNILLKDDKAYPYIKITVNEMYPRVLMAHQYTKDKARYFGPYTDRYALNETLDLIHSLWKLRRCSKKFPRDFNKERPCLNKHMEQCLAPCTGTIDENQYKKMIKEIISFLNGKHKEIIKNLEMEMQNESENLNFEKAGDLRDKILALKKLSEKQIIDSEDSAEQDIIAFAKTDKEILFQVFFVRGGKMIGREYFLLNNIADSTKEEIMTEFIKQYYTDTSFIPKEIILEEKILEEELILNWLEILKGQKVKIIVPQKGDKLKLVNMAHKNAIITLDKFGDKLKKEYKKTIGATKEIQETLELENIINRIEAYDISNTQGFQSVGSMVVFENGVPKKSDYRKFKIKTIIGPDDYGSMEEVITRRFLRYKKEQEQLKLNNNFIGKFSSLPDILFVDGGKGQISVAKKAMEKLEIYIPIAGMVKDDKHKTKGLIYNDKEINFKENSEGFKLITRIQDEVHRFAIDYHRKLREENLIRSILDDIPYIGNKRRRELMKHFGSVEEIKKATLEQLEKVSSMNSQSSKSVYNFFNK